MSSQIEKLKLENESLKYNNRKMNDKVETLEEYVKNLRKVDDSFKIENG